MRYLIVVEDTQTGYSAFSPDLLGCVATGSTQEEVKSTMREAIAFHLDGIREEGLEVPLPHSTSAYLEIPV